MTMCSTSYRLLTYRHCLQELGKLFKHSFKKVQDLMASLQDTEDKARRVSKLEHDCATCTEELKLKAKSLQDLEYHLEQVKSLACTVCVLFPPQPSVFLLGRIYTFLTSPCRKTIAVNAVSGLQVERSHTNETKMLKKQMQDLRNQLREAQEAEYTACRKLNELIASAAPSQREYDLERQLAREVAERKKLDAELERQRHRMSLKHFFDATRDPVSSAVTVASHGSGGKFNEAELDAVLTELAKVSNSLPVWHLALSNWSLGLRAAKCHSIVWSDVFHGYPLVRSTRSCTRRSRTRTYNSEHKMGTSHRLLTRKCGLCKETIASYSSYWKRLRVNLQLQKPQLMMYL